MKSRLNSGNACYRSFLKFLSPWNIKTVILSVVMYGCETWSLSLREQHRLKDLENRVLRKIFGPKGDEMVRR
jgi:hypothetical protein